MTRLTQGAGALHGVGTVPWGNDGTEYVASVCPPHSHSRLHGRYIGSSFPSVRYLVPLRGPATGESITALEVFTNYHGPSLL